MLITTLATASILSLFNPAPPPPVHKHPPKHKPAITRPVQAPQPPPPPPQPAPITFPFDLAANYPNSFYAGQCTAFVASKVHIPWSGNANMWDDNARAMGITVSDVPVVGAVAETDRGEYGHVALVIALQGSGAVQIIEANYDYAGSIRTRWALPSEFKYIYY